MDINLSVDAMLMTLFEKGWVLTNAFCVVKSVPEKQISYHVTFRTVAEDTDNVKTFVEQTCMANTFYGAVLNAYRGSPDINREDN